jgi:septal ring factor EnvC (AmiA/AmiB activator)|tara:strand:- start:72 stop:500 length:429 start_codon:yes stop_codon:yes gene_type:complete
MAQLEFAGMKFTGGKMAMVITLVTSLIGGLWGGFEVYKDYMDMKAKIQNYTAPDLSGIDKRIAVLENELSFVGDLKNDLKTDVRRIESIVNDVEQRVKEDSRANQKDLTETIKEIKSDMEQLEEKVIKQIQIALENPLSNMK